MSDIEITPEKRDALVTLMCARIIEQAAEMDSIEFALVGETLLEHGFYAPDEDAQYDLDNKFAEEVSYKLSKLAAFIEQWHKGAL